MKLKYLLLIFYCSSVLISQPSQIILGADKIVNEEKSLIAGKKIGTTIRAYLSQMGAIQIAFKNWEDVNKNPFFCPNQDQVIELEEYLDGIRADRDSVGAKITVVAENVPVRCSVRSLHFSWSRWSHYR